MVLRSQFFEHALEYQEPAHSEKKRKKKTKTKNTHIICLRKRLVIVDLHERSVVGGDTFLPPSAGP